MPSRAASFTMRVWPSLPMLATAWPPPRSASALPRRAFHRPVSVKV